MGNDIKVGVVGYGVIGKRVADAVDAQVDMTLVGVADVVPSALMSVANLRGFRVFASTPDAKQMMEQAGITVAGNIDELLGNVDVVVDATPKDIPGKNIAALYKPRGIKFIVEGGEKHGLTGLSFSTFANYDDNVGAPGTRVVSCNTTGLCRVLSTLDGAYGVQRYHVDLVRRGTDPLTAGREGPSNAVVPVLGKGSHHYEDVETCMPGLKGKGYSMAVAISHTLSHIHMLQVDLEQPTSKEELVYLFGRTPRINVVKGEADGLPDTARVTEFYKDQGRLRGDNPEVTLWGEGINVINDRRLGLLYVVHMESIPIPENVDAIRALTGIEKDRWQSARMTDAALGTSMLPGFFKPDAVYGSAKERLRR